MSGPGIENKNPAGSPPNDPSANKDSRSGLVFHWGKSLSLFAGLALLSNAVRQPGTQAPHDGLSLDPKNPLTLDGPGSVVKIGYHRPGATHDGPTSTTIEIKTADKRSHSLQPHAPDFKAPPLSHDIQEEIAKQIKQSGLEAGIRSGAVKITSVHIHGRSSPEGTYATGVAPGNTEPENEALAMERAKRCFDEGIGPALLRSGVSSAELQSKVSFSAEEVQFSQETYAKLLTVANNHDLGGGLQHDAVHRLIRAYNTGSLGALEKDEANLLQSAIDDARGAVVTITLSETPAAKPATAHDSFLSPLTLTLLVPPFIPLFSRKRESEPKGENGTPSPTPSSPGTPTTPSPTPTPAPTPNPNPNPDRLSPSPLPEQVRPPQAPEPFTAPAHIPLPAVPGRGPEQVRLDVLYDLYTNFDVHPKVDYRALLAQAKLSQQERRDSAGIKSDLTNKILTAWSECDGTDYSKDQRQQAYARAHAEVLVALDEAKPRGMDILDKLRLYTESTAGGLPAHIDSHRTRSHSHGATPSDLSQVVGPAIDENRELYQTVTDKVRGDCSDLTSEAVIKRQLEGGIYKLWERLDGTSHYHNPLQRGWAAAFAEELYNRNWKAAQ